MPRKRTYHEPGNKIPATPREIAIYGHIAAALRRALDARGWSVGDLNQAMGVDRSQGATYQWLSGKAGPGRVSAEKLSKLLNIPVEDLTKRKAPDVPLVEIASGPVALSRILPPQVGRPPADLLGFSVDREGRARIKLDVILPVEQGAVLLRMLLDQGLVISRTAMEHDDDR